MPILHDSDWNKFLLKHPDAHLLQTAEWGSLKSKFGWEVSYVVVGEAGAQVLFRRLPLGYTLAYIPKGPVGVNWEDLWLEVDTLCRSRRTVFLKVELDTWEGGERSEELKAFGFRPGGHEIQPRQTVSVDIRGDEEEMLARMKQKTRYNIRLAGKKWVVVEPSPDVETFAQLMGVTGERDQFGVHNLEYYRRAYELFHPSGACELLLAFYEDQPLAGVMVFAHGKRAWYFYGASNNLHRNRMPTYILQWEAIRWARQMGCTEYDLWGVPDFDEEVLEAQFSQRSNGLWGVYRFKRGFGGELKRSSGAWDKVYIPLLYSAYKLLMARRGYE